MTAARTGTPRRLGPAGGVRTQINRAYALLLASPFHRPLSRAVLLLSFTGRTSGRRYTIPVDYVQGGPTLHVLTNNGWWRNMIAETRVEVRLRGRTLPATARAVPAAESEASDLAATTLTRLLDRNRVLAPIFQVRLDRRLRPRRDDIRWAATDKVVVEIAVDDPGAPASAPGRGRSTA